MKSIITIILISAFSGLFVRCTLEKRLYNRGFHVEWNKKIHQRTEKLTAEKKKTDQIKFTAKAYSQNDSVIEIQERIVPSEDSPELAFNIHNVSRKETEKDTYSSFDKQTRTKLSKKVESDETKVPANKKALIFALVFTLVIIGFIVLLVSLNPAISAEMITLGLIIVIFGTAIFFDKIFNRKSKQEDAAKENTEIEEEKPISSDDSPKLADSKRTLTNKRSNAIVLTVISLLAIGLGILALLSAMASAGISGGVGLGLVALFSVLLGFLFLMISAVLWSDYHDAKKAAETNETEPELPPTPKVKGRGWILLGILILSISAAVFDYFRTN